MAKWNVYRTTPLGTFDAPDRWSALARAQKLWGSEVRVQSVASEQVQRDELSAVRKRKLPNRWTDYRGDEPPAA